MVRKYREEELIEFLFRAQGGKCARCKKPLDPDGRSVRVVRSGDTKGKWQNHHHPPKSLRQRAFGENWDKIVPEMPINMRLICLDCHDYPHGGKHRPRPTDPLLLKASSVRKRGQPILFPMASETCITRQSRPPVFITVDLNIRLKI